MKNVNFVRNSDFANPRARTSTWFAPGTARSRRLNIEFTSHGRSPRVTHCMWSTLAPKSQGGRLTPANASGFEREWGLSTGSPTSPPARGRKRVISGEHVALHVAPAFDGCDRQRLAHQVKYMIRPPVALECTSRTDTGNVRIEFNQAMAPGPCVLRRPYEMPAVRRAAENPRGRPRPS